MGAKSLILLAMIGESGCGKSEVSKYLTAQFGCQTIKTGAICRSISKMLFGNEDKSSTQLLDDALTSIDQSIFLRAALRDADLSKSTVVDSLRFASDAALVTELGFKTLRVRAPTDLRVRRLQDRGQVFEIERDGGHRSEVELAPFHADFEISNNGTLVELHEQIQRVAQQIL